MGNAHDEMLLRAWRALMRHLHRPRECGANNEPPAEADDLEWQVSADNGATWKAEWLRISRN